MNSTSELNSTLVERCDISLDEVIELISPKGNYRVVWGGSLVEGFGNSTSDVDLYVICEDSRIYDGVVIPVFGDYSIVKRTLPGKNRLDINYVSFGLLTYAAEILENFEEFGSNRPRIPDEIVEITHRLLIGKTVYERCPQHLSLPRKIKLIEYIVAIQLEKANSYQLDVNGALDENDLLTAMNVARLRMRCVVDAWLARQGQTNTRFDKWRIKKLRISNNSSILEMYLRYEGLIPSGEEIKIKHLNRFCENLMLETL
jgi:predicted nucleotidyltransferase